MSGPWFLISLFVGEISLFFIIRKWGEKVASLICVLLSILGTIYMVLFSTYLPWSIDATCISITYVYIGYRLRRFEMIDAGNKKAFFIVLALLVTNIFSCIWNYKVTAAHVDLYATVLGNPVAYWIESLTGAIGLALFVKISFESGSRAISGIFAFIGKSSLLLYALHGILFDAMNRILELMGVSLDRLNGVSLTMVGILFVIIAVSVLLLLDGWIKNKKWGWVLGSKN